MSPLARTMVVASFGLLALGALAPAAASVEAPRAPRAHVQDYFSKAEIARADRYRGPRTLIGLGSIALNLVVLGVLGLGRGSRRLGALASRIAARWWLQALVLAGVLTFVPLLAGLPLDAAAWARDRDFGLATDSLASALADSVKATGFQAVASAVAALAFLFVARRVRRAWPVVVAAVLGALTFAFVFLLPLVYEPAFNRFTPVDAATRARILALARREGVGVRDVLVADASRRTTRANAYVSGIGGSRRVVLYDTLLARTPADEIDLVVAHELAHVKHRDVLKGTVAGVAGVAAGVAVLWWLLRNARLLAWIGASGPGDPRVLPFLALFVAAATLLTSPVQNALSRKVEAAADRTAIEVTRAPEVAIRLEVRLARDNIADLTPNQFVQWFFGSHPTTLQRIQAALDYRVAHP